MNGFNGCRIMIAFALVGLLLAGTSHAGVSLLPSEDREINHLYYGGDDTVVLSDGQWWPAVRFVSSPEEERRFVMKYDLSSQSGGLFSKAILRFYVKEAWNFNTLELDAWFYEADDTVGADDFTLGTELVGSYHWSAPAGNVELNTIGKYAEFDVTEAINNRAGDTVFFNIRLAGGYPDFEGNVFGTSGVNHDVVLAAVENSPFAPSLELTAECTADADDDRDLDGTDLSMLIAQFGAACSQASPCTCDFNSDNVVDAKDLSDLAADFGRTNCPDETVYTIRGHVFGINTNYPGPLNGITVQ